MFKLASFMATYYYFNAWRYIAKFGENISLTSSIKHMNFEAMTFNNEKNCEKSSSIKMINSTHL